MSLKTPLNLNDLAKIHDELTEVLLTLEVSGNKEAWDALIAVRSNLRNVMERSGNYIMLCIEPTC